MYSNVESETRIYCGFRENMIQESTKPFDEVDSNGLVDTFLDFYIQECMIKYYMQEYAHE